MRAIIQFEDGGPIEGTRKITQILWNNDGDIVKIISTRYIGAYNTINDTIIFTPIYNSNERFECTNNKSITCKLIWLPT